MVLAGVALVAGPLGAADVTSTVSYANAARRRDGYKLVGIQRMKQYPFHSHQALLLAFLGNVARAQKY